MRNGIVRAPCSSTSFFSFLFALPLTRAPSFTCRGGIRLACRWQSFPAANLHSLHPARNLSLPQISQRRMAARRRKRERKSSEEGKSEVVGVELGGSGDLNTKKIK